jgi:hypothetical protein
MAKIELKGRPGFSASRRLIAVDCFYDKAHSRARRERGRLVGLEDAAFECRCHCLNHVIASCITRDQSYPRGV